MSIQITEIQGYNSISNSRIIINDNFNILAAGINDLIEIIDIEEGIINLTSYNTGTLSAKAINITGGLTASGLISGSSLSISGNSLVSGVQTINTLKFGQGQSTTLIKESLSTGSGTFHLLNLNGNKLNTKAVDTFDGVVLPKIPDHNVLKTIQNPKVGTLTYSLGGTSLWLCVASGGTGATGTWVKLQTV